MLSARLELAHPYGREILSLLCLPIPPREHLKPGNDHLSNEAASENRSPVESEKSITITILCKKISLKILFLYEGLGQEN